MLEKYDSIWNRTSNFIEKKNNKQPVYDEKCLNTKLKSCNSKVNTNFYPQKTTQKRIILFLFGSNNIYSVYRIRIKKEYKYFSQIYLEECK